MRTLFVALAILGLAACEKTDVTDPPVGADADVAFDAGAADAGPVDSGAADAGAADAGAADAGASDSGSSG